MSVFLFLIGGSGLAQDISVDQEKSRLWIEGRSNVNQFNCRAERYNTSVTTSENQNGQLDVEVDISVSGFECGKRRMNRDLYEALMAEQYPNISFEYKETRSMSYNEYQDRYTLVVTGNLTVAGHTKKIEFPMEAYVLEDGTLQASGQTTLRMTDYNVDPPTAMLGLVKVDDLLTVHFELFASTRNIDPFYDEQFKN